MVKTYDRIAVGSRLKEKRKTLGFSRVEVAQQIGRAEKYYADIERGSCGMSIETMMALSELLGMSLDNILYGKSFDEHRKECIPKEECIEWIATVNSMDENMRRRAKELLEKVISLLN